MAETETVEQEVARTLALDDAMAKAVRGARYIADACGHSDDQEWLTKEIIHRATIAAEEYASKRVDAEREACGKIADDFVLVSGRDPGEDIAALIRNRQQ